MFTKLLVDESGQSLVEYGLILGFVSVVAASLLLGIQIPLDNFFESVDLEIIRITSTN